MKIHVTYKLLNGYVPEVYFISATFDQFVSLKFYGNLLSELRRKFFIFMSVISQMLEYIVP